MSRKNVKSVAISNNYSAIDSLVRYLSRENFNDTVQSLVAFRRSNLLKTVGEIESGHGNLYILTKVIQFGASVRIAVHRALYVELLRCLINNEAFLVESTYAARIQGTEPGANQTPLQLAVKLGFLEAVEVINNPQQDPFSKLQTENEELKIKNEVLEAEVVELRALVEKLGKENSILRSQHGASSASIPPSTQKSRFEGFFATMSDRSETKSRQKPEPKQPEPKLKKQGDFADDLGILRGIR